MFLTYFSCITIQITNVNKCEFYKNSYFLTSCYSFTIYHIQCIYCFWKCYIYMYKLIWYLWVNINYFRFVYHGSANFMVEKFVFLLDCINNRNRSFKDLLGLCSLKRLLHVCLGTLYTDLIIGQSSDHQEVTLLTPQKKPFIKIWYICPDTSYTNICGHIYTYTYPTYVQIYHLTKWHHFTTCLFTLYRQLSVLKYR